MYIMLTNIILYNRDVVRQWYKFDQIVQPSDCVQVISTQRGFFCSRKC